MLQRVQIGIAVVVLAASGVACKKKTVEDVKKDVVAKVSPIVEVPAPEGLLGSIVMRDPESVVKRIADGAGLGATLGPSPYQKLLDSISDDNTRKVLKALDPHGTIATAAFGKIEPDFKPHGIAAAHLKDPEIASAALAAVSKSGSSVQTWNSKALGVTVYDLEGKAQVGVFGDLVLVADDRDTLDLAGKYVAWRASQKVDHDLLFESPFDEIGPKLRDLGNEAYAKVPAGSVPPSVKSELDPLVPAVLASVGDAGKVRMTVDVRGDVLELDQRIAAKGRLSSWFSSFPKGDASGLLALPQGDSASVVRFPDGIGPLAYAGVDLGLEEAKLSKAEAADASKNVRALGKALGNQIGYVTSAGKGAPKAGSPFGGGLNTEIYLAFDLADEAAALGALKGLQKTVEKVLKSGKSTAKVAPYKKFGADGQTFTTSASMPGLPGPGGTTLGGAASSDVWVWAVKGGKLHVDLCLGCTPALIDAAIDPASTATLAGDPAAKARISEFPGKDLVSASYGTKMSLPGLFGGLAAYMGGGAGGAPPKPGVAMWSYAVMTADGIEGKGTMPVAFIGEVAQSLMAIAAMRGGMGGPPPPY
jgi:hypothetical protein